MWCRVWLALGVVLAALPVGAGIGDRDSPWRGSTEVAGRPFGGDWVGESLTLRPLPSGELLIQAEWRVETVRRHGERHFNMFPKRLAEVLDGYNVQSLAWTLASGRAPPVLVPTDWVWSPVSSGATLWVAFDRPVTDWSQFTEALAGLFCASFKHLAGGPGGFQPPVAPQWFSGPLGLDAGRFGKVLAPGRVWAGFLPGEALCTENLTPMLNLLPGRGSSGLAAALKPGPLFGGGYSALSLAVEVGPNGAHTLDVGVTAVVDPPLGPWSVLLWSGAAEFRPSPAANVSRLQWTTDLDPATQWKLGGPHGHPPTKQTFVLQNIELYRHGQSLQPPLPALSVSKRVLGSGAWEGTMAIEIRLGPAAGECLTLMEVIPWYIKPIWSSLTVQVNGKSLEVADQACGLTGPRRVIAPGAGPTSPSLLEFAVVPPVQGGSLVVSYGFERRLLHFTEYPPDANRGIDVPPTVVHIIDSLRTGPSSAVYSNPLLLYMPSPDFSMPYNVITLTSTLLALAFGSILNLLTRGPRAGLLASNSQ